MVETQSERRPLRTRDARWARALAAALARRRVSPNAISLASVGFATLGALALACTPAAHSAGQRAALYVAAAALIQARLVCNLLDGMVAIEGGLRSKSGELFNEVPDRVADVLLIAGAGYAAREIAHAVELGWIAASLALLAAYVRALGRALGAGALFLGPFAKQHRMATLTLACLAAAALSATPQHARALVAALLVLVLGTTVTIVRRLLRIRAHLEAA